MLFNHVACFQAGVLYHHGEMGHQHEIGCQLAEQSPEQLYSDTVRGYDWSVHQGEMHSSLTHCLLMSCLLYHSLVSDGV